jgi:hypothetical protein
MPPGPHSAESPSCRRRCGTDREPWHCSGVGPRHTPCLWCQLQIVTTATASAFVPIWGVWPPPRPRGVVAIPAEVIAAMRACSGQWGPPRGPPPPMAHHQTL